jgi:hypothetical protein
MPPANSPGVDTKTHAMYGIFLMSTSWVLQTRDNHPWAVLLDDGVNLSMPRKV